MVMLQVKRVGETEMRACQLAAKRRGVRLLSLVPGLNKDHM